MDGLDTRRFRSGKNYCHFTFSHTEILATPLYSPEKKAVLSQRNSVVSPLIFFRAFLTAHAQNHHISTSGIKSDVADVFSKPDFI